MLETLTIFNRSELAASPEWIHIVPKGELPNAAAGVVQVLDDKAIAAIMANIAADQHRLGEKWTGVYAGREHHIYNEAQDSAALGWFKRFEVRPDGIWASADGLTPAGRTAVANRDYKFTSFVTKRADTEPLDGDRVRILKVDTIGFTNNANGKEMLTPIANRAGGAGSQESGDRIQKPQPANQMNPALTNRQIEAIIANGDFPGHPFRGNQYADGKGGTGEHHLASEAAHHASKEAKDKKSHRAAASAHEDAGNSDTADYHHAMAAFHSKSAASEGRMKNTDESAELQTLRNRIAELEGEQIAAMLDAKGIKDEAQRKVITPVLGTLANRAAREEWLGTVFPAAALAAKAEVKPPLTNRAAAGTPGAAIVNRGAEQEKLVNSIRAEKKCGFEQAWSIAKAQRPELFSE